MKPKTNSHSGRQISDLLFVVPFLVVIAFYIWLVGTVNGGYGTTTHYFARLADAFLNGRLYLAGIGKEIPIDLSYYNGQFYMYWGPVPALVLMPIQYSSNMPVGDFFLAFFFVLGIFLAQSALLFSVWDRYFNNLPRWTLHLSVVMGGFAGPLLLLRHYGDHARVYEAAIAAGQFFLLSGLLMAFVAVTRPSVSNWRLALAGTLWALSIGSRHILILPIAILVVSTIFLIARVKSNLYNRAAGLASLGLPLLLGLLALSWYNWTRFGSIFETGLSYQLADVSMQDYAATFSPSYVIPNLYNYLLNPPGVAFQFPFVSMLDGVESLSLPFYTVPEFYTAQPITGLLFTFPFSIFASVPLLVFLLTAYKGKLAGILFNTQTHPAWIALGLGFSFFIPFSMLMVFFWTGTRYEGDFLPPLTVLSTLGFWHGYAQFIANGKYHAKYIYVLLGVILAVFSIFANILLMISLNSATAGIHHALLG